MKVKNGCDSIRWRLKMAATCPFAQKVEESNRNRNRLVDESKNGRICNIRSVIGDRRSTHLSLGVVRSLLVG